MSEHSDIGEIGLESTSEKQKTTLDALLVFGQGPVIDPEIRVKAADAGTVPGKEDINVWSQSLAEAAAELYKKGQTREIIVMGGKTGGEQYLSEADLIARQLSQTLGVPESAIKREAASTNTLENLVNLLNEFIDREHPGELGILGSDYHTTRIRLLMNLFDIPVKQSFSAEAVLRAKAYEDPEFWKNPQLNELDKRLDHNSAGRVPVSSQDALHGPQSYFDQQQGTEQKNIITRAQEEDVFKRALIENPEYWIMYLGRLNNTDRIRTVLDKLDQPMLKERFTIDPKTDSGEELKAKLVAIPREIPSVKDWLGQDWSQETQEKMRDIDQAIIKNNE